MSELQDRLDEACEKGNFADVCICLREGGKPDLFADTGWSPFGRAAANGHAEVVRLLITDGKVNPNLKGTHGVSALHVASVSYYQPTFEN